MMGAMTEVNTEACMYQSETKGTADNFMRKLLRIPEVDSRAPKKEAAERLFSLAMLISALRCTLSYVVLPFILPALGLGATVGLGPVIGLPIGIVAIYFDVKGIRRFWVAQHKYRWQMSAIYIFVIGLVTYLVIGDIFKLL